MIEFEIETWFWKHLVNVCIHSSVDNDIELLLTVNVCGSGLEGPTKRRPARDQKELSPRKRECTVLEMPMSKCEPIVESVAESTDYYYFWSDDYWCLLLSSAGPQGHSTTGLGVL